MKNIIARKRTLIPVAAILVLLVSVGGTHHGWSNYNQKKTLTFTGEIAKSTYENPHGMISLKLDDKTWTVVLAPPSRMETRGLEKSMLKVGTTATVVGYPHKSVKDEMRAERITIGEKTTELR